MYIKTNPTTYYTTTFDFYILVRKIGENTCMNSAKIIIDYKYLGGIEYLFLVFTYEN